MNDAKERRRPLWHNVLLVGLLLAIVGLGTSSLIFSGWTQLESTTPEKAALCFNDELALMEDQRAYLTIAESGKVEVQRKLEKPQPSKLVALHLLAYETGSSRLARVRFPFWFIQVKTTNNVNLGTLVSLLAQDWTHLDLKVTEHDLMRRGPGLVLDHTRSDGGRIVLWSE